MQMLFSSFDLYSGRMNTVDDVDFGQKVEDRNNANALFFV